MKLKFILTVVVIIIAAFLISSAYNKQPTKPKSTNNETVNIKKPLQTATEKIVKEEATEPTDEDDDDENDEKNILNEEKKSNIPLAELAGPVHNVHGIRDDIFRYIEINIPPENKVAMTAAIKYSSTYQFIYYKATQEEALKSVRRFMIARECLGEFLPDGEALKLSTEIQKLMNNTPDRDKHLWGIDKTYFNWKILGHEAMSNEKLKKICEEGNY